MSTGLSANRAVNDSGKTHGTMNMIRARYLVDYYKMSSSCLNLFFPGGPIFSVLGSSRNDNASIQ